MNDSKKKELIRVIKFTLFSISAGVVQVLSFALLNEFVFKEGYWIQYLISVVLSVIWNFTLNRNFTFKSASNIPVAMAKTLLFYVFFIPLSTFGGAWLETLVNEYVVLGVSMILNFTLEYLYQRFYVFRGSLETKDINLIENENV